MLVDGREVDRVNEPTTLSRLERMCKLGAGKPVAKALIPARPPAAPRPFRPGLRCRRPFPCRPRRPIGEPARRGQPADPAGPERRA